MAENLDYRQATEEERRHTLFPGDPAADYFFVDKRWQDLIFEDERQKAVPDPENLVQEGVDPPESLGEVAMTDMLGAAVVKEALQILDAEAVSKV